MRIGLVVVAVLLGACSTDSLPASGSPSGSPQATAFDFTCRLPVSWIPSNATPDATNSGTALLSFPQAQLSATTPLPTLPFTHGPSYDVVTGKWLPVSSSEVSPDGLSYAYADYDAPAAGFESTSIHAANVPIIGNTGRVHVVDAQTGADRVVFAGQPTYTVVAFTVAGLYLARFGASLVGTRSSGLLLLGLSGSVPQPVLGADFPLDAGGWRVLDGGGAWGIRYTEGLGAMWPGNQLVRLDLGTHSVSIWLTVPIEDFMAILGFEGGRPLVFTEKASYQAGDPVSAKAVLLTAPNEATQVMAPGSPNDPLPSTTMPGEADSHGLWIGGSGTLWLYRQGSGLRHINLVGPNSMVEVGGGCACEAGRRSARRPVDD
jgi:hypothetical protein